MDDDDAFFDDAFDEVLDENALDSALDDVLGESQNAAVSSSDQSLVALDPDDWRNALNVLPAELRTEWEKIITEDELVQLTCTKKPHSRAYRGKGPSSEDSHMDVAELLPQLLRRSVVASKRNPATSPLPGPDVLKAKDHPLRNAFERQLKRDIVFRARTDPDFEMERFPFCEQLLQESKQECVQ